MITRKWLIVGVAVGTSLAMLCLWASSGPKHGDVVRVGSWADLGCRDEVCALWPFEGQALAKRIRKHRYDDLFVFGRTGAEHVEKLAAGHEYLFLQKVSHPVLPSDLSRAAIDLGVTAEQVRVLEKTTAWFLSGSLAKGGAVDITCRYDPETGTFLAHLMIQHGSP